MLEALIEAHPAPKSLLVVSSDHRVQRAARHSGATYIDSDQWYAERQSEQRNRGEAEKRAAKPRQNPTPDEVNYWVKRFADPGASDEPESLFPPGYGEDLLK
jgi:hypothetical protein